MSDLKFIYDQIESIKKDLGADVWVGTSERYLTFRAYWRDGYSAQYTVVYLGGTDVDIKDLIKIMVEELNINHKIAVESLSKGQ